MAKADDERSPLASGGAGEKFRKRPFRPEIYEEPQNVSHEAGKNVGCLNIHQGVSFANNSVTIGKSELEQMLKQMTFRSEAKRFILLLHSRTIEEPPTPPLRLEASTTTGSTKRHKLGDERDTFYASFVSSSVLEEDVASALRQDSKLINKNATCLSITSVALPQHPMTMEKLPDEILLNIFIRLLAKQLAQMRSVSKSWNYLLTQSSFIKSHLHHSIHHNDQILLLFLDEEESSSDSNPLIEIPSRSPCLDLTKFIKLPVNPNPEDTSCIRIIGAVNGLICSCYGDSVIHIWNPSISAVLTLPPYSTPSSHGYNSVKIYFRFGFDPKTDDYKVVKLTGLTGPFVNVVEWWLQIEIYSMRKGSWELITERFPSHIPYIITGDYVCVDGHDGRFHWFSENMDSEKIIVAFDLGSQTFREMPFPDSTLDHNRSNLLGVLAKKLCVMSCVEDGVYEVWVMDEYGVAESWVKRHVFSQFSKYTFLYGFTSHSEFLIVDDGYLVMYDPFTNKKIILEGYCPAEDVVDNIIEYVDSLVWVKPTEQ